MARLQSAIRVVALAGETVDALVYRVLGKGSPAVEQVMASNPNLCDQGLFLNPGQMVMIPAAATTPATPPTINLWD
ncbi:MAG: tail protein X [Brevundimonas sp.]|uniref:tail protein X n=1 Tax=Brevundimonas sp. TaxID=1871086 RepID=UPI002ABA656E|nr:tail protein X [Brevundimonas sp.]MDZ4108129.1 tail protein X [Brevundimonas sp.]